MRALLTLAIAGIFSVTAWALPCPSISTFQQLQSVGSCEAGPGGNVTFSNFQTNLPGTADIVSVQLMNAGLTTGFTFSNTATSNPFSISYTATCSALCLINGGHNSSTENPAGAGSYKHTIGPASGTGLNFNASFAGLSSVSNEIVFGGGSINQSLSMNVDLQRAGGVTPEPTSFILFGSGFMALGLVSRFRKRS